MRDVYEVLPAKEILVEQLRREIEALRLVAPLLTMIEIMDRSPMHELIVRSRMLRTFAQLSAPAEHAGLNKIAKARWLQKRQR